MATETAGPQNQYQEELPPTVQKPKSNGSTCKKCGATSGVYRQFTGIGATLCLGLCCFMGTGVCLAYATRRRHCQKCFTTAFEQSATKLRREVCFIDDKSLRPAPTPCFDEGGVNVPPNVAKC